MLRETEAAARTLRVELRLVAGLRRAQARGVRVGRPRRYQVDRVEATRLLSVGQSLRAVARQLQVHPSAVRRALSPTEAGT